MTNAQARCALPNNCREATSGRYRQKTNRQRARIYRDEIGARVQAISVPASGELIIGRPVGSSADSDTAMHPAA